MRLALPEPDGGNVVADVETVGTDSAVSLNGVPGIDAVDAVVIDAFLSMGVRRKMQEAAGWVDH